MKVTKKIMALALSATLTMGVLSGCGQSQVSSDNSSQESQASNSANNESEKQTQSVAESQPQAESQSQEEVTINFWHHYSAQSAENETLMNVLIPKFEEENPGIKVNAVSHEWADLHEKILINAKADTLPDVARLDSAWIPEFQKAGILVALDEEMSDFNQTADGLLESAMSTNQIGGHYYGLALNTNTKILFYNTEALEAAGVQVPTTMDEFVEAAKKLSGNNENGQQVWGYDEPALAGWNLCPFIWSYGGDLLSPDQTTAEGYINGENTVKAIQMLADLYNDGALTGFNSGDIPMTDGFGNGRYMMLLEGPWKISEMEGAYPDFEYATAGVPAGDGGSISVLGGEDISMFNSSNTNKEAAWKFMQFMTSEFAQVEMAKCSQIPVNKTALENDTVKAADFAPFLEAITTAKSRPTVACWSEIDSELTVAVTDVMNGNKTAQEAMDELAVKVDELLAEE
jgi:multiple sugar transport system substrate-binding protein